MSDLLKDKKIALAHDYLTQWGGAEAVFKKLLEIWPDGAIYTLLHDQERLRDEGDFLRGKKIQTAFINRWRFFKRHKKWLLPFLMVATETFDLGDFDIVLASSGAFIKGLVTRPKTMLVCYCHSPMRFAWDYHERYLQDWREGGSRKVLARGVMNYLRLWDIAAAERVDYFVANSQVTAQKIAKYYHRKAEVIYPPIEEGLFRRPLAKLPTKEKMDKGYFVVVSRLSAYKKIDLIVEAFNKLKWRLLVVGEGEEKAHLKKIAGPTVKVVGFWPREKVIKAMANSLGMIQASDEDFGIAAAESLALGRPVLAYRAGGALEMIEEGRNGEFFDYQSVELVAEGVYRLRNNWQNYVPEVIRTTALKFHEKEFKKKMLNFVEEKWQKFNKKD